MRPVLQSPEVERASDVLFILSYVVAIAPNGSGVLGAIEPGNRVRVLWGFGREGALSNPVQRRLTDTETDELVARYRAGSTIDVLAHVFGVHRTTVMTLLERQEVPRRSPRKLTDELVADAAHRYTGGETLAQIAANLGIAPSTLTRELQLAGITIGPRGRPAIA